jgi:hypothetical protein
MPHAFDELARMLGYPLSISASQAKSILPEELWSALRGGCSILRLGQPEIRVAVQRVVRLAGLQAIQGWELIYLLLVRQKRHFIPP